MQKVDFQIHDEDFFFFRRYTDEVEVFTKKIAKELNGRLIRAFLDIGAGSGELTKALASKLKIEKTIAIDRNIPLRKFNQNIIFLKRDWLDFSYPEKFDLILSCHSIAYLPSQKIEKAIGKIYDYLKPGGVAMIIVYNNSDKAIWSSFKRIFYPKGKTSTSSYIEPIIANYPAEEKHLLTRVYADNLEHMFQIGRFLAEKHLASYLIKKQKVKDFFKKFQAQGKKIVFPLEHKMFILYKLGGKDLGLSIYYD